MEYDFYRTVMSKIHESPCIQPCVCVKIFLNLRLMDFDVKLLLHSKDVSDFEVAEQDIWSCI